MKSFITTLIILLFCTIPSWNIFSQKKDKIKYTADELLYIRIEKEPVRKLLNNVVFIQGLTTIKCDSAYYFNKKKIMEAYGNVIITDEDSLLITANKLVYNGNKRIADLSGNVIYSKKNNILKTKKLIYDFVNKIGKFKNKGRLTDQQNILISDFGEFYSDNNFSVFNNNVELISPDYTLKSDTLKYYSDTKIAYTFGQTKIITKDSVIVNAEGGEFFTDIKFTEFDKSSIETNEYFLKADEITLNKSKEYYSALGNVKLISKFSNYIITGEKGFFDKKRNITKIYDKPILKKIIPYDTFYLSSDTIIAFENINDNKRKIVAFNDVKLIKKGLEGKADSISYFLKDSLITMFKEPILWNENNQITSDTINFELINNVIQKMILNRNSFIISLDTMKNFNQIKGRKMISYFDDNNYIKNIHVTGNGESIYYALHENENTVIGLNYMICSDMNITFENNEIRDITFYQNPRAKLIPPHEIKDEDLHLKGFKWRENERPILEDVVYYFRKKIYLRNEN